MGKTFQLDPTVIGNSLGIEDVGIADEDSHTHLGTVNILDAHNRFLHLLITWFLRPSGGKLSTIRQVDVFWLNCFRQNNRPNLAQIIFIEIVDLVRDRHLASVQSFTYGTGLSRIFEKLKIDCSADLVVHNANLPHDVPPTNAEDVSQAPVAPIPRAFSFDPMIAYLDGKFASLVTYMDEGFDSINRRIQAIGTRQNSMEITLNAFRAKWRGHNLGPSVGDEED
ncbi:hypothetical protein V6N12_049007 [Hibiscus sabdariffa]|uniref:Uncharacterized protein n=1 Tax=Hibiscus sabdariffa TaxID=183260 RepID=A0ABR2EIY1_9ROSI